MQKESRQKRARMTLMLLAVKTSVSRPLQIEFRRQDQTLRRRDLDSGQGADLRENQGDALNH